jgi:hypothetical protein
MPTTPAYVLGRRTRVLAWNRPASVIFCDFNAVPDEQRSLARLLFLSPDARQVYGDWQEQARRVAAWLHLEIGRHPEDGDLSSLVAELSAASPAFRGVWAEQHVSVRPHGTLRLRHPRLGSFSVAFRVLRVPEDPDQLLVTHTFEPGFSLAESLG